MDKQHFDQLVKGVREMKRHMAGKSVRGAKATKLPAPSAISSRNGSDPPSPSRSRAKNGL
jgi:hypothetical protein